MANDALIEKVFGAITEENLGMGDWGRTKNPEASCGTTMCFAGHAAVQAGYELRWEEYTDYDDAKGEWYVAGYTATYTTDGQEIEDVAREALGFTRRQAHGVFYATSIGNDVKALRERVDEVLTEPWYSGREYWEV